MIKLIELIEKEGSTFLLEEVWINPKQVIKMQRADSYKQFLTEGKLPEDLDKSLEFTSVIVNGGGFRETHVVVGSVEAVVAKLSKITDGLLFG
jgi:hypothetical protein